MRWEFRKKSLKADALASMSGFAPEFPVKQPGIPRLLRSDPGWSGSSGPVAWAAPVLSGRSSTRETVITSMANTVQKDKIISEYKTHEKDTGSCEVQIALLSARIAHLTEHLKDHRKDFHSRRGLIQMTSKRRKLLDYLKRTQLEKYKEIIARLEIRR